MTRSITPETPAANVDPKSRAQFLVAMYSATWDNINRHLLVVWQSVAALFTALGAAYLSVTASVPPDLVASFVIVTAGWAIAIGIDASAWYNRNLLIISNIERQFLHDSDVEQIHYYFSRHRSNRPIDFLLIQIVLATIIGILALVQHFAMRVLPGFGRSWTGFQVSATLPYLLFAGISGALCWFTTKVKRDYNRLKTQSPGRSTVAPLVSSPASSPLK